MRKLLLSVLFVGLFLSGFSQYNLDLGFHAGASNYLGDIGGKEGSRKNFVSDMKMDQTRYTVGGFARYKFFHRFSGKVGLNLIRISCADNLSTNPGRAARNLSFRNDIVELALTAEYVFYEIPDLGKTMRFRNDFKMFAFVGIGGIYSNPKTEYKGEWVALQPLKTEGVSYSKFNASVPLGVGFYVTMDKKHRIGWEINWRTTFTDYLDDISTVYADPKTLSSEEARALANRRGEIGGADLPHANNYEPGNKRGDPSHKDSYISTSFSYSYVLRGKSSFYRSRYGSVFKGNSGKRRKVRAKF